MTFAVQDAHPIPLFNARFRVTFPIFDASGNLVSGATGLDSERSLNQGTFTDCTNEAIEIATGSGLYYLDLTAAEMFSSSTTVIVKSSGKTTVLTINPEQFPIMRSGTAQAGAAGSITLDAGASSKDDYYNGCYVNITNNSPANAQGQARKILDYDGSTKVATIDGTWGTNPTSASTFDILAYRHTPAAGIEIAAANKLADHFLRRTYANARASGDGDTFAFRSLMGAVAHLVNRVKIAAGVKTVYQEDDTTAAGTSAVTTNPVAEPIVEVDP